MSDGPVLPDDMWERALQPQPGGPAMEMTSDGRTQLRDGEWRLVYTGPTYGRYRIFDGWWKEGA